MGGKTHIIRACINNYLGPLIESNIMYDFDGIEIDSRRLFE